MAFFQASLQLPWEWMCWASPQQPPRQPPPRVSIEALPRLPCSWSSRLKLGSLLWKTDWGGARPPFCCFPCTAVKQASGDAVSATVVHCCPGASWVGTREAFSGLTSGPVAAAGGSRAVAVASWSLGRDSDSECLYISALPRPPPPWFWERWWQPVQRESLLIPTLECPSHHCVRDPPARSINFYFSHINNQYPSSDNARGTCHRPTRGTGMCAQHLFSPNNPPSQGPPKPCWPARLLTRDGPLPSGLIAFSLLGLWNSDATLSEGGRK